LEFARQHGFHGIYFCFQAHLLRESAVAEFYPMLEMIKLEDGFGEETEEFVFSFD
jgi:hypothetical protein